MMFGSMGIWIQLLQGIQSLCNCNEALAYTSSSWWAVGFALAALCLNFMNRMQDYGHGWTGTKNRPRHFD